MPALYSHTTRSTGTTVTAVIYNSDHQNHIDNGTPQQHDDYSSNATQMQSMVDPGEDASESLATSLAGELERLRFAIKDIKTQLGLTATQWYSTPTAASVAAATWSTGDVKATYKTTADTGWVMMNDGTIGNAASGGTTRANADTVNLFTLLWNNTADAQCAVSTGRGASAAADYAANKTIALPKALSRALAVSGAGSGLTSRVLALANGAESKTIGTTNLPASGLSATLSLSGTAADHAHQERAYSTGDQTGVLTGLRTHNSTSGAGLPSLVYDSTSASDGGALNTANSGALALSGSASGTTANMGSGNALDIMNPMQFLNVMVKL